MKLLITPALTLSDAQKEQLSAHHELYFINDERLPLCETALSFSPDEIEGIVCNLFFVNNPLSSLPNLKFIQLTSAGLDRVPLDEIRQKGIALYNAGATYATPMAEWALARILDMAKNTAFFNDRQQEHAWVKHRHIRELDGMTAAVVGFGHVGKAVAKRLRAFGVSVTAVDIVKGDDSLFDDYCDIAHLDDALSAADIVVLTLPLTDGTRGLMNKARFDAMKQDAMLVNIARGAIIDEDALINALRDGKLYGAALDVFVNEPLPADHPLWSCDRVLLSPHNSFVGNGNTRRLTALVENNLNDFAQKETAC